jgi:anti-anti-sigma factor
MGFAVEISCSGPLSVLKVHGDLDLSTAHHLRWAVDQALAGGCRSIAVDLVDVPFIDCAALGALIAAKQHVDETGQLWLHGVSAGVARLLQLTGTAVTFTRQVRPTDGRPLPAWSGAC